MTVHSFKCERCKGTIPRHSRRKGFMERILTPPPIVRYYRCGDCGDRYPGIGLGEHRVVLRERTQHVARVGALVVFCAGVLAALLAFFTIR